MAEVVNLSQLWSTMPTDQRIVLGAMTVFCLCLIVAFILGGIEESRVERKKPTIEEQEAPIFGSPPIPRISPNVKIKARGRRQATKKRGKVEWL